MDYLVELYNKNGDKTYNYRAADPRSALDQLVNLMVHPNLYPFVNASCYYNGKQKWNLELN